MQAKVWHSDTSGRVAHKLRSGSAFAILAAFTLLASCERPTADQSELKAIKAESDALMTAHASKSSASLPKHLWPQFIARLEPDSVTVYPRGVNIKMKPGFDGGWGYEVPRRDKRDLLMLPECYSDLGEGVFWHGPC
jgi:hypothetical protein